MFKDKISVQEITDYLASNASVSKRAAEDFLKAFIASVEEALLSGESVKIKNFGTFKLQWNEPRKSVNVQTGEEIMLAGYPKVTFTPEAILKDLVNEPFAHLEPVELDANPDEIPDEEQPEEEVLEPLRIFTEQATEIRSLLSEIHALSVNSKPLELKGDFLTANSLSEETESESEEPVIEVENTPVANVVVTPVTEENPLIETEEIVTNVETTSVSEEKSLIEIEEIVSNVETTSVSEERSLIENEEIVANVETTSVSKEKSLIENEEIVANVETISVSEEKPIIEIEEIVANVETTSVSEEKSLIENEEIVANVETTSVSEEKSLIENEEIVANVETTPISEETPFSETKRAVTEEKNISRTEDKRLPETDFPDFKPELEILSTLINTFQEKKKVYTEDAALQLIEDPIAEPIGIPASVYTPNPFLTDAPPMKKRNIWLWVSVTLLILAGGSVGLYFYSLPVNEWVNSTYSGWFTPKPAVIPVPVTVVVPVKMVVADSAVVEEPVDSLQILFDYPRVYTDFIASEHIVAGSRLARMSERYYGNSHFWVYIYEANKERIPNPDMISPGTLIRIPRLDPRLIDGSNPRCLQKARELHDLYVNR